ncbi:MAG: hypothetical protein RDU20_04015 [Desulfomonilaceae bacterium]|nr:hypothetical protein [Desulfomonilaceae bacterium]
MDPKYKPAITVIGTDLILFECPFCGKTLIRTDFQKIQKLVDYDGMPKGKVCPKCKGVAILRLKSKDRETIKARIAESSRAGQCAPTEKIEDLR